MLIKKIIDDSSLIYDFNDHNLQKKILVMTTHCKNFV